MSGIGILTALAIVAKLPAERLRDAKAAAAYAGLHPANVNREHRFMARPRICKTGNGSLTP